MKKKEKILKEIKSATLNNKKKKSLIIDMENILVVWMDKSNEPQHSLKPKPNL